MGSQSRICLMINKRVSAYLFQLSRLRVSDVAISRNPYGLI